MVRPLASSPGAAARWYQAASSAAAGRGCSPGPGAATRGRAPRAQRRTPRTRAHRSRCRPAGSAHARSSSRRPPASFLRKSWTSASCLEVPDPDSDSVLRAKSIQRSTVAQLYFTPTFAPSHSTVLANASRGKTSSLTLVGSVRAARIGGWAELRGISAHEGLGPCLWTPASDMPCFPRQDGGGLSSGGVAAGRLPLPRSFSGRSDCCPGYGS